MANLQYIGARYVPIVYSNPDDGTSNWKSGVAYENLVIVTYLDDSYTSRKPVPSHIGNPAANPIYWSKTGDFNAALTSLQNAVNNIENNKIPEINTRLDGSKIVANPAIVLLSDSYGVNDDNPLHLRYSWFDTFETLAATYGYNIFSQAEGGASFGGGNGGHTYGGALTTLLATMSADDKANVVAVVIGGGFNDSAYASTDTNIRNGITNVKTLVANNFPNCKEIMFNFIGNSYSNTYKNDIDNWIVNLRSYLEGYAFRYSTYAWGALHKYDNIQSDAIHPTQAGAEQIGRRIFSAFMCSGDLFADTRLTLSFTGAGVTSISDLGSRLNHVAGILTGRSFTLTKTSLNGSPAVVTGNGLGYLAPPANYDFMVYGSIDANGGPNAAVPILIRVTKTASNVLQLTIRPVTADTWSTMSIDNFTLQIPIFEC